MAARRKKKTSRRRKRPSQQRNKNTRKDMRESPLERELALQIRAARLPTPTREALLIPGRKYRFDFAWPAHRLAVEVQGGIWRGRRGAHSSGTGITRDCEKAVLALLEGYRVLPVTGGHVRSGQALRWIRQALEAA